MAPSEAGLVRRTIWLLRTVAAHPDGVGLSDVAREAGIPKATCYRVLTVLERESWLTLDAVTRRYRVSLGLLSIVGGLLDGGGSYTHMREVIRQLASDTKETAGFDVMLAPQVMVVAQTQGPSLIGQTPKPVPRTQPVWATSTGKVLLAALPPEQVQEEFAEEFTAHAPKQVGTFKQFVASLDEVREREYAFSIDELETGAASIAAPVRVRDTTPYAVWIGGPSYRMTPDAINDLSITVRAAAQQLGELLSVSDLDLPSALTGR